MNALSVSRGRIAKNTISQVAAFGISGATKAGVAVLVARWLGPEGFGIFTLAWTIASMVSFFSPLGLDYMLIRELNRSAGRRDIDVCMSLALISGVTVAGIVLVAPRMLGAGHDITAALSAGAAFVVVSAPIMILRASFHARERMELETATLALEGVVGAAAVLLLLSGGGGVGAAMLGLTIGRAANLALSLGIYRKMYGPLRPAWEPARWMSLLRVSVPMGASYIFNTLMLRFDVVMLAMFRSPAEVGLYTAGTVIVMTIPMIASAFSTSLYPILSRASGTDDPQLRRIFNMTWKSLLIAGFVCAAGLTVLAKPVVELLYGRHFGPTAGVIVALAWILPFRFVNNLSGVVLNATDRAGARTLAVGTAAGLNIAINFALIPLWGFRGAVVSTLVTELVLTGVLRYVLGPLRPSFAGLALWGRRLVPGLNSQEVGA